MPSIHTAKAMEKARRLGAFAGDEAAAPLWDLSKRELLEVALRLGAQVNGTPDDPRKAVDAVQSELSTLRTWGIV